MGVCGIPFDFFYVPTFFKACEESVAKACPGLSLPLSVLATSARRRRFVRHVLQAKGIPNPVLSFDEIGTGTQLTLLGTA